MAKVRLVEAPGGVPTLEIDPEMTSGEELLREISALKYSGPCLLPKEHPAVQDYFAALDRNRSLWTNWPPKVDGLDVPRELLLLKQ